MSMRDATGSWTEVQGSLEVTELVGLNVTLSGEHLSLRLGRTDGDFDLQGIDALDQYLAGVTAYGFPQVAARFGVQDRHGWFQGVGMEGDWTHGGFLAEYTERGTDGLIADSRGWYVTLLAHIGRFSPYAGVSRLQMEEDYADVRAALPAMAAIPDPDGPGPAPAGLMLAGATQQFMDLNTQEQESVFAGVRCELGEGLALKAEWQQVSLEAGSTGILQRPDAGFTDDTVNVYSLALDARF